MYPDTKSLSANLYERAKGSLPGGNSRYAVYFPPYPIYAASAEGCRVTDVDGVSRIDFVNNMTAIVLGHSNPKVVEAVRKQAGELMAIGMPTEAEIKLAELMCDRVPGVDRIRFTNSGTEGVMYAIRAARAYTGRDKVMRIEGAYNGGADVMETSQGSSTPETWGDPSAPNTTTLAGVPQSVKQDVITVPYNDIEATRRLIELYASDVAAFVICPYTPRLAFTPASEAYLKMLRDETKKHGIKLIFDEVMSFRSGYHGAQGLCGVTPDYTAFGKVLGGGMPIGAFGGTADAMSVLDHNSEAFKFSHSGTFNANPMSMAAGYAALSQMTPEAYDHIGTLAQRLRDGLTGIISDHDVPGRVQGIGSLSFLRLGDDAPFDNYRDMTTQHWDMELHMALHHQMLNAGVSTADTCAWFTSHAMTEADIDFALEAFDGALKAVKAASAPAMAK